jgi:hypothetical protein
LGGSRPIKSAEKGIFFPASGFPAENFQERARMGKSFWPDRSWNRMGALQLGTEHAQAAASPLLSILVESGELSPAIRGFFNTPHRATVSISQSAKSWQWHFGAIDRPQYVVV